MTITVNGEPRDLAAGTSVDELLATLGVQRDGTAVALNDAVVRRGDHATTVLNERDRIEIIVAVAGG